MSDDGTVFMRPLGLFDLELAAAIHGACFEAPWDARTFAELMAMPGAAGVCALANSEPAGLILFLLQMPDAEILTLGVLPKQRRRGIGHALLAAAADRAREAGADRLLLDVATDNRVATSLHHRVGFRPLARRPRYYRRAAGPAVDADVLVLELRTGALPGPAPAGGAGK
jgi:[ribosomal protein S18]-alanine N-acetyltransferase